MCNDFENSLSETVLAFEKSRAAARRTLGDYGGRRAVSVLDLSVVWGTHPPWEAAGRQKAAYAPQCIQRGLARRDSAQIGPLLWEGIRRRPLPTDRAKKGGENGPPRLESPIDEY